MTRLWAAAAVLALLAASHGWAWRAGRMAAEAAHAAELHAAETRVRQTERDLVRAVDRVAEEAYDRERATDADAIGADAALGRLRAEIAARDAAASDTLAAARRDAAAARSLLARCADRYGRLAREADRVRGQLLTLQDYVRTVRKSVAAD